MKAQFIRIKGHGINLRPVDMSVLEDLLVLLAFAAIFAAGFIR